VYYTKIYDNLKRYPKKMLLSSYSKTLCKYFRHTFELVGKISLIEKLKRKTNPLEINKRRHISQYTKKNIISCSSLFYISPDLAMLNFFSQEGGRRGMEGGGISVFWKCAQHKATTGKF
jgi:hypothetical protein